MKRYLIIFILIVSCGWAQNSIARQFSNAFADVAEKVNAYVVTILAKKEIKVDPNIYTVTSGSGDYHVRHNPSTNKYTCDCMGFWRVKDKVKGCKHIIEVRDGKKR